MREYTLDPPESQSLKQYQIYNAIGAEASAVVKRVGAGELVTLYQLFTYYNGAGYAWPSVSRLASDLGTTERTIYRHLRKLARYAYIARVGRTNQGVVKYAPGPELTARIEVEGVTPGSGGGDTRISGGVTPGSGGGDTRIRGGVTPVSPEEIILRDDLRDNLRKHTKEEARVVVNDLDRPFAEPELSEDAGRLASLLKEASPVVVPWSKEKQKEYAEDAEALLQELGTVEAAIAWYKPRIAAHVAKGLGYKRPKSAYNTKPEEAQPKKARGRVSVYRPGANESRGQGRVYRPPAKETM